MRPSSTPCLQPPIPPPAPSGEGTGLYPPPRAVWGQRSKPGFEARVSKVALSGREGKGAHLPAWPRTRVFSEGDRPESLRPIWFVAARGQRRVTRPRASRIRRLARTPGHSACDNRPTYRSLLTFARRPKHKRLSSQHGGNILFLLYKIFMSAAGVRIDNTCSGIYCNDWQVTAELDADVPQEDLDDRVHHSRAE